MRKLLIILAIMSLGISSTQAQRYDRGIEKHPITFVKKGSYMFGGSLQYSVHNNTNYHFLIVENINTDGYRIQASPVFCYMIRDNMGIGVRAEYRRTMFKADSAQLSIFDTDISVKNYHVLNQSTMIYAVYRNYIPLGTSQRFALFNETRLGFGFGRGKIIDGHGASIVGSFEKTTSFSLGVCPGLMAFATRHLALEVNAGVFGLEFNNTKQIHNQVYEGSRNSTAINFHVNIFAIGFGLVYYM